MKINVRRTDELTAAINAAQGGARARRFNPDEVEAYCQAAERQLHTLGIPKKYWKGCSIRAQPQMVARSYKAIAHGTGLEIRYFPSGWFLIYVGRLRCGSCAYGTYDHRIDLRLSNLARASMPFVYPLN